MINKVNKTLKNNTKIRSFISIIFLVVVFVASFTFAQNSYAYLLNATDLLGQLDKNNQPVYTTALQNNITIPNALGFNSAMGVSIDTVNHRLFVSDGFNNRVLIFNLDSNNNIVDYTADYVLGQPDFTSNTSATTQNGLFAPYGITYDSVNQRLFVSDYNNSRIMVFDVTTITNGENAVNVLGQPDFTSNLATTTQSGMNNAYGIAYDSVNQRLFVSDYPNNRIMVFDVTTITNGENAVNVLGQPDFTSNLATTTQSGLNNPYGVTYDSVNQRLFASDFNNNRIMVFDVTAITNGENAVNVLGQPDFTSNLAKTTQSGLSNPYGIIYDSTNQRLFLSDSGNSRIMVFDVTTITNGENAVNVLGQPDFIFNIGTTTQGGISGPFGITYDSINQRLFVADYNNYRVIVFDVTTITNGENAVNVLGQSDYQGNVSYITSNINNLFIGNKGFNLPTNIFIDTVNHRLFVSDGTNNRVLIFNLDSNNNIVDYTADYVLGQPDFTSNTPTEAPTQSGLTDPRGITYDSANQRLFVSDNNNRIMVFDVTTITNGENAVNVLGQPDFTSNLATTTQSGMNNAYGIAYDSVNQRLFVSDYPNNRIMVFDVTTITNGENAVNVLGQPDFTSNLATTTQSGLNNPYGVTYDSVNQRLFASDFNNNRIMVFDVTAITNGENAVNVLGQPDFTSNLAKTTQSGLSNPYGIIYDSTNQRLFLSDSGNSRIMVFDVTTITNGENAVNVLGQPDFTSNLATTTQSGLNNPYGVTYDSTNRRLFLGDSSNNRVLIFQLPQITTASLSSATVGQSYSTALSITGGASPYSCSLLSGSLPVGLTVNSNCTITGTPTSNTDYNFTVRVMDSAITSPETTGFWYDKVLTLTVNPAVSYSSGGGQFLSNIKSLLPTIPPVIPPLVVPPVIPPVVPPVIPPVVPSIVSPAVPPIIPSVSPQTSSPDSSSASSSSSAQGSITSVVSKLQENISLFANKTIETVKASSVVVRKIVEKPIVKTFEGVAVVVPTVFSLLALINSIEAGVPIFSHIFYPSVIALQFLGFRRKPKPWGTVYDSRTKRPIPFARVEILNEQSRKLQSTIADANGRYGFLVSDKMPNIQLRAYFAKYDFPSKQEPSVIEQKLYPNIYKGGFINSLNTLMNLDLPMDPRDKTIKPSFYFGITSIKLNNILTKTANVFFIAGVILGIMNIVINPSVISFIIFAIILITFLFRVSGFKLKQFGLTKDKETNKVLPFGLIALHNQGGERVNFTVSDDSGRYFLLTPKGNYSLKAFTPSHILPARTKEISISTKKGWISKEIEV